MTKEKRKLYRIKSLKRKGLSYQEIAKRIGVNRISNKGEVIPENIPSIFKKVEKKPEIKEMSKEIKKIFWWTKIVNWIKRLFK